jgi:hypothetical protein
VSGAFWNDVLVDVSAGTSLIAVVRALMRDVNIKTLLVAPLQKGLQRFANGTVSLAALVAGRGYPWAAEAWRADLLTKANGSDDPMPAWRRPFVAFGMLIITAPKMRLLKLTWRTEYALRRFGRWLLFCEMATDALIGALAVSVTALLTEDLGFWVALVVGTVVSLCAVQGVILLRKRLRNSTSSSPE